MTDTLLLETLMVLRVNKQNAMSETERGEAGSTTIAWQWWQGERGYERPGRWSKQHRTLDGKTTLCGLVLPRIGDVADYGGESDGEGWCRRCGRD